jgi:methanogenic corrinoid protein MtbC1
VSIAQEHFASNVLRGRLLGLARGWGRGTGPRALLACPEGEHHDLGLIAFGLALRERGWRIDYLGSDTPVASIAEAAEAIAPELLVLTGDPVAEAERVTELLA